MAVSAKIVARYSVQYLSVKLDSGVKGASVEVRMATATNGVGTHGKPAPRSKPSPPRNGNNNGNIKPYLSVR